jgi:hypothetical protein
LSTALQWIGRVAGAALLGATAGIHADLYNTGYRSIPKIGPMFLAWVISAAILCLLVIGAPRKLLAPVAAAGALLEAGTAVGLVIFTNFTIFDFRESTQAPHYWQSIVVEGVGFVVLAALAAMTALQARDS